MTPNEFRRIALKMKGAIESAHMGHPDFRVNGRVFATLAYPDKRWGMVVLTPDQQQEFMNTNPATFVPASGAWGRSGCTTVRLDSVEEDTIGEAMTLAWQHAVQKSKGARPTTTRPAREPRTRTKRTRT